MVPWPVGWRKIYAGGSVTAIALCGEHQCVVVSPKRGTDEPRGHHHTSRQSGKPKAESCTRLGLAHVRHGKVVCKECSSVWEALVLWPLPRLQTVLAKRWTWLSSWPELNCLQMEASARCSSQTEAKLDRGDKRFLAHGKDSYTLNVALEGGLPRHSRVKTPFSPCRGA